MRIKRTITEGKADRYKPGLKPIQDHHKTGPKTEPRPARGRAVSDIVSKQENRIKHRIQYPKNRTTIQNTKKSDNTKNTEHNTKNRQYKKTPDIITQKRKNIKNTLRNIEAEFRDKKCRILAEGVAFA